LAPDDPGLIYPLVLGLDRLKIASFLRFNSTLQYLAGFVGFSRSANNPCFRMCRSYQQLLCIKANSSYLWDAQLRSGHGSLWSGYVEMLE
jgi:hypothetical protein